MGFTAGPVLRRHCLPHSIALTIWVSTFAPETHCRPAVSSAKAKRIKVVLGLLGLVGQLGLILWLPHQWLLLIGVFLGAALFAPLLPMLEAAALSVARPAQRTLMLAALSTLIAVADVLGTLSMGALMRWTSSTAALGVCLGIACLACVVCSI